MSRNTDVNSAQDKSAEHDAELIESKSSAPIDAEQPVANEDVNDAMVEEGDDEQKIFIASPIAAYDGTDVPAPDQPVVPTDDKRYIKFGLIFLLITLGGFSVWAGFAPLGSALIASGEVVVNSYRKSIMDCRYS